MPRLRKRTEELQMLAVQLYSKLGSGNAVAKKLGVSPPTAYAMLKAAGISIPGWADAKPLRRKTTAENRALILEAYNSGMSLQEMEVKFGIGQYAIRACVKREGAAMRTIGGRKRMLTEDEILDVVDLYKNGWSQAQIALKLKSSQTLISRVLRNQGVKSGNHMSREGHHGWKGGISKNSEGYILQSPSFGDVAFSMRSKTGYVPQHRLVMANYLGRPLLKSETVHHINGDKADNRIENLQLRIGHHGSGVCYKCSECGSSKIEPTKIS